MATTRFRPPAPSEQEILDRVRLRLPDPANAQERERFRSLMAWKPHPPGRCGGFEKRGVSASPPAVPGILLGTRPGKR